MPDDAFMMHVVLMFMRLARPTPCAVNDHAASGKTSILVLTVESDIEDDLQDFQAVVLGDFFQFQVIGVTPPLRDARATIYLTERHSYGIITTIGGDDVRPDQSGIH
jgi:hypothetical protein